jgi:hypothetical protein
MLSSSKASRPPLGPKRTPTKRLNVFFVAMGRGWCSVKLSLTYMLRDLSQLFLFSVVLNKAWKQPLPLL